MDFQGKLLIFSAPSGSGKTTIVRHLIAKYPMLEFSVSACSRDQRNREVHGKDYYFLSVEEFKLKIEQNQFVEWEEVYPNAFYGTLASEVQRIWSKGNHVLFDVDVKGGLALKRKFGDRALAVFVMPPSVEELRNRLIRRGSESHESIQRRIGKAQEELSYSGLFDVVLVNNQLDLSFRDAEMVVEKFLSS